MLRFPSTTLLLQMHRSAPFLASGKTLSCVYLVQVKVFPRTLRGRQCRFRFSRWLSRMVFGKIHFIVGRFCVRSNCFFFEPISFFHFLLFVLFYIEHSLHYVQPLLYNSLHSLPTSSVLTSYNRHTTEVESQSVYAKSFIRFRSDDELPRPIETSCPNENSQNRPVPPLIPSLLSVWFINSYM